MKPRIRYGLIILAVVSALVLILSLFGQHQDRILVGKARDTALEYVEPIVNNIVVGIQGNDYKLFTSDFSANLSSEFSETAFHELVNEYSQNNEFLNYSIQPVWFQNGYIVAFVSLNFQNASIQLRITIEPNKQHRVVGFATKTQ